MQIEIDPEKGISSFEIGENIDKYTAKYEYVFLERGDDSVGWDEYDFFDGALEVYVSEKERAIEAIRCTKTCSLHGVELIGSSYLEFLRRLDLEKEKIPREEFWINEDEKQWVYDVDELSLQLWVDRTGVIRTVFFG
jgi:hypothetical protein